MLFSLTLTAGLLGKGQNMSSLVSLYELAISLEKGSFCEIKLWKPRGAPHEPRNEDFTIIKR